MARAVLQQVSRVSRKTRRPQHPFQISHMPWQMQPFMCAPVLPGETLKNVLFQARVVTDPIKNPLVGWWIEYYMFYVKHRDLDARDLLTSMMLDVDQNTSSLNSAAKVVTYHRANTVDWMQLCLNRIRDTYFRDEDEIGTTFEIGGLPLAHINKQDWNDSLTPASKLTGIDDVDVDLDVDGNITAGEVDAAMRTWEFMRANALTDASYEDFLATYGVRPKPEDSHRPELIRYFREWSYPTNHIDPTSGAPSSAVSWSVAERGDKDRFFREPGFVVGITVARPKVYLTSQQSLMVNELNNAISWLPAIMHDDPATSLREFVAGGANGPLSNSSAGYWVDLKDLFLYGEQFINFTPGQAGSSSVALPAAAIANKRYPSQADIDGLFVTPASAKSVRQDGVCNLDILTHMSDTTPQGIQG